MRRRRRSRSATTIGSGVRARRRRALGEAARGAIHSRAGDRRVGRRGADAGGAERARSAARRSSRSSPCTLSQSSPGSRSPSPSAARAPTSCSVATHATAGSIRSAQINRVLPAALCRHQRSRVGPRAGSVRSGSVTCRSADDTGEASRLGHSADRRRIRQIVWPDRAARALRRGLRSLVPAPRRIRRRSRRKRFHATRPATLAPGRRSLQGRSRGDAELARNPHSLPRAASWLNSLTAFGEHALGRAWQRRCCERRWPDVSRSTRRRRKTAFRVPERSGSDGPLHRSSTIN